MASTLQEQGKLHAGAHHAGAHQRAKVPAMTIVNKAESCIEICQERCQVLWKQKKKMVTV